ncbi:MAG: gliding motility-associated C-terminal domain-containing protein, partial [Bacteroidia bacterium]|nr:gliding motility-associated C-terminal domain-containing protein [Bacteroidia bacterium]NNJ54921.1 T9SS type B sorting domain-containing protein [Bacteroidia bacterium]
ADTGLFEIKLVANSNFHCLDTSSQFVRVVPDILIFIPNAFTPNHRGPETNDKFTVSSAHAQEYFIEIFNKWGQKVYTSTNIKDSWDGNYLGKNCQDGVYAYSIELINKAGQKYTYHGTVNLIR